MIFYFKTSRRISDLGNAGYPILCFGVGSRPTDLRTKAEVTNSEAGPDEKSLVPSVDLGETR